MVSPFEGLVSSLSSLGFFGYVLPFILFFTLTYAILLKSKWIENQRIMGVVSLVVAFFVLGFGGQALGNFLTQLFGAGAVIIAGLLVILLFFGMAGKDVSKLADSKGILIILGGIGIVIFISLIGLLGVRIGSETISTLFVLVILGIAIWVVTNSSS